MENKCEKIAKLLIERGANINDNEGIAALIYVSSNGHLEILKLLLENGVSINDKDDNEMTALTWASEKGYVDIVKLL